MSTRDIEGLIIRQQTTVNRLLDLADNEIPAGDEERWLAIAFTALDQAGFSREVQQQIAALVGVPEVP